MMGIEFTFRILWFQHVLILVQFDNTPIGPKYGKNHYSTKNISSISQVSGSNVGVGINILLVPYVQIWHNIL
jgi:hypothetical protein